MLVRAVKDNNRSGSRAWVFGRGFQSYLKEQKAVEQQIKSQLLEFTNDCYFALQNGINWRFRLGYHNQKTLLDEDIQRIINNNSAVLSLTDFTSTVLERSYNTNCLIYTIYSETPIKFNFNQGVN